MQARTTLDPESRTLYGENLQPPPGYFFDGAVATTFSLDFETALAVPVSLALFAAEDRTELLSHPLALLEGAERIAGKLFIFADTGRLHAQARPASRLCSLLEQIIIEVTAPKKGAFHPKMWAIRYKPIIPEHPQLLRLLVLSRNLTRDRSWDVALTLDGAVTKSLQANNKPLADFILKLPDLATAGLPKGARDFAAKLAEDVRRTEWELPEGFEEVSFAVNGLGGKQWRPAACDRLGVISPFCDDAALSMIADLTKTEAPIFLGRSDELACITPAILKRFSRISVLDDTASSEDGEEAEPDTQQGLHAKVFVAEKGWHTEITVGSGNATSPALLSSENVEIFASLSGKTSRLGGVNGILGEKGFGRLTRPFIQNEAPPTDPSVRHAERRLDTARRDICQAGLKLCFEPAGKDGTQNVWSARVQSSAPLALEGLDNLRIWPITRGEGHCKEALQALRNATAVDLGAMPLIDSTRFIAFQLTDAETKTTLLFSTGLETEGLPFERHAAILRWVIDSKDAFFRYLRLILSELGEPFSAALAASKAGSDGDWGASVDDAPLLEELVRAFCRKGDQLQAIERLMTRLGMHTGEGADPVPSEFRTLWEAFKVALNAQERIRV